MAPTKGNGDDNGDWFKPIDPFSSSIHTRLVPRPSFWRRPDSSAGNSLANAGAQTTPVSEAQPQVSSRARLDHESRNGLERSSGDSVLQQGEEQKKDEEEEPSSFGIMSSNLPNVPGPFIVNGQLLYGDLEPNLNAGTSRRPPVTILVGRDGHRLDSPAYPPHQDPNSTGRTENVSPFPSAQTDPAPEGYPSQSALFPDLHPAKVEERGFGVWFTQCLIDIYVMFLFQLPRLYHSRVLRILIHIPDSGKVVNTTVWNLSIARHELYGSHHLKLLQFKESWEKFVEDLLREWNTLNIISGLILPAILTLLQIDSAGSDPVTRTPALLSFICAMMSLLYGCISIVRFGSMRDLDRVAEWLNDARREDPLVWWNPWIMLAIPAVWLAWSLLLFLAAVMSFAWRTTSNDSDSPTIATPDFTEEVRIAISCVLGLGILYLVAMGWAFSSYDAKKGQLLSVPFPHAEVHNQNPLQPGGDKSQEGPHHSYQGISYSAPTHASPRSMRANDAPGPGVSRVTPPQPSASRHHSGTGFGSVPPVRHVPDAINGTEDRPGSAPAPTNSLPRNRPQAHAYSDHPYEIRSYSHDPNQEQQPSSRTQMGRPRRCSGPV